MQGKAKEQSVDMLSIKTYSSDSETTERDNLLDLFKNNPLPENQILNNLGLFLESKQLSRILFMDHLYQKIIDVQGVIMEFGTHWGQNTALFTALRGIYEPFNRHRKIIGFDTFTGFPKICPEDGDSDLMEVGRLYTTEDYPAYLTNLLQAHQNLNPLSHIQKNQVCVGDGGVELEKYLRDNPETILALAYFDFDLYEPTKQCLELISNRITKGTVLGFDELNDPDSPGETIALMEVFGLTNVRLKRFPYTSRTSYFVVE